MKSGGLPIKFVPVGDAGRMTAEQIDREAVAALVEQGIERYQEALGAIVRMVNAPNKRRANEIGREFLYRVSAKRWKRG
ncbi:MAG: hypothetical protein IT450_12550 [Phycisphaerales bacterium]|nr:hypothetical protein [Phycisphaerales bacterium]